MSIEYTQTPTDQGAMFLVGGYDSSDAWDALESKIASQTGGNTETPTPAGEDGSEDGGPIRRFNDVFTNLGSTGLEAVGLHGYEIANAIRTRRDELFRNEFPLLKPRFELQCEECGAEYDSEVEECEACGSTDLKEPSLKQKRDAEQFFESVNKEGQSLRDLMKLGEDDQGRLGVSAVVVKYEYVVAESDTVLFDEGSLVDRYPVELIRADPKRVVPVVDEDGRIGGHWWTCPIHREEAVVEAEDYDEDESCPECGCDLREVFFAEVESAGGMSRDDQVEKYFFDDEVVSWAHPFPRLNGLDGLSEVYHVWLKQAILEFQDQYAGAFYDPDSERLPNQFMILHTTNPDQWEEQLNQARERAKDDQYDSPIFTNQYSPQSASTPEVQVIDSMPDELLGQNQDIKKDYKSDIRAQFGVTDVFDSELEDAGGLNNEGLQMEVTDRHIASKQHDYIEGPLDELGKYVGLTDWKIEFIPSQSHDIADLKENIVVGAMADQAGLHATFEDDTVSIGDGDFAVETGSSLGQLPGPTGGAPPGDEPGDVPTGEDVDTSPDPNPFMPSDDAPEGAPETKAEIAGDDDSLESKEDDEPPPGLDDVDVLYEATKHIVWCPDDDVEQKAMPFFDKEIPVYIKTLVQEALRSGVVYKEIQSMAGHTLDARRKLRDIFETKLTQPQGWSLRSLSSSIQEEFDVDEEDAEAIARNESKAVLDKAREEGYERAADTDEEVLVKHVGPRDDRKHEACWWLIDETKDGVPMDEYRSLIYEANEKFVDSHDARGLQPHINCRDTFVRVYS